LHLILLHILLPGLDKIGWTACLEYVLMHVIAMFALFSRGGSRNLHKGRRSLPSCPLPSLQGKGMKGEKRRERGTLGHEEEDRHRRQPWGTGGCTPPPPKKKIRGDGYTVYYHPQIQRVNPLDIHKSLMYVYYRVSTRSMRSFQKTTRHVCIFYFPT